MNREKTFRARLLAAAVGLFLVAGPAGCGDGDRDEPDTAALDLQRAEEEMGGANFSTAYVYYELALEKLLDDDPSNDGDVPADAVERASYGSVLTLITLPLKIAEGFIQSWLLGDRHPVSRFIKEDYLRRSGSYELPTNLVTVYLLEFILPDLDRSIARIDSILEGPDFAYPLPPIRLALFGHAYELPHAGDEQGLGRHDLVEASLLSTLLHMGRWLARSVTAYNLDMDVANIDAILEILMSGDLTEIFSLVQEYPHLLTLSSLETNGVDGAEMLASAHEDLKDTIHRIRDDEDGDGQWETLPDGQIDPEELPDDFFDALAQDSGSQVDHIVGRAANGFSLNVRDNGTPMEGGLAEAALNLLVQALFHPALVKTVEKMCLADAPPELRAFNGIDDDCDGVVDDVPLPVGLAISLLGIPDWSGLYGPDLFPAAFFTQAPDVRDLLPAWDEELGDPGWFGIVVDRTETYDDVNGNGRYDPGVDILDDAPHTYGHHSYPPDGRYQPVFLFIDDPTLGSILGYRFGAHPGDDLNLLNLLVSGLAGGY